MSFPRRTLLGAATAALAMPHIAHAQDAWPNRPVRIVVPFPPGGSNDAVARPLAEHLQRELGQPFVVENRPGAGSTIGSAEVARAPADGYTLMVTSSTFSTSGAVQKTPYDPAKDFEAVSIVATAPLLVIAAHDFPPKNLAELAQYVRANPGKVDYGSSGPGGINHLAAELFAKTAGGLQMQHVPYRGMGPATTDLVAGTIQLIFTTMPSAAGIVRDGRVKVLGWTAENRPANGPSAPTPRESGLPDYEAGIWWGLLARSGLPAAIRDKLNKTANEALSEGRLATYLAGEGATPSPLSAKDADAYLKADLTRWRELATTANIRVD